MAETRKNYNYFYDAHYASQSSIEAQWTELMSFDRLDHVKSLIDTSGSNFNNLLDVGAGDGNVLRRLMKTKLLLNIMVLKFRNPVLKSLILFISKTDYL